MIEEWGRDSLLEWRISKPRKSCVVVLKVSSRKKNGD